MHNKETRETLTQNIQTLVLRPGECSDEQIHAFVKMVMEGGQVGGGSLEGLVRRAAFLAFAHDVYGNLIGVGALKKPNEKYREKVFQQSLSPLELAGDYLELGWIYVKDAQRGKGSGRSVIKALMEQSHGDTVYATTREDNEAIQHLLVSSGFSRSGDAYHSSRGEYNLLLWVGN